MKTEPKFYLLRHNGCSKYFVLLITVGTWFAYSLVWIYNTVLYMSPSSACTYRYVRMLHRNTFLQKIKIQKQTMSLCQTNLFSCRLQDVKSERQLYLLLTGWRPQVISLHLTCLFVLHCRFAHLYSCRVIWNIAILQWPHQHHILKILQTWQGRLIRELKLLRCIPQNNKNNVVIFCKANQIFCWVCTGKFGEGQSDHDTSAAGATRIFSTSAWTKALKPKQKFYLFGSHQQRHRSLMIKINEAAVFEF